MTGAKSYGICLHTPLTHHASSRARVSHAPLGPVYYIPPPGTTTVCPSARSLSLSLSASLSFCLSFCLDTSAARSSECPRGLSALVRVCFYFPTRVFCFVSFLSLSLPPLYLCRFPLRTNNSVSCCYHSHFFARIQL